MSSPQMFTFSWSELTSSLASTAQQLHLDGELVDVTLSAGGKIFHAHKLVLSAASPLLMEMLKSTKCTNPIVLLAGISSDDLESILQFIYHGEVTIDPVRLPCLLQAAQNLDIRALTPPPSFDKIVPSCVYPSSSHYHQGGKIPATSPHATVKKHRRSYAKVVPNVNEEYYNGILSDQHIGEIGMDQSLSEGDPNDLAMRRASIVSDLPVSCHICGLVIRQSRNLRRHMELVHMRTDHSQRASKKKKCVETTSPSLGSSPPLIVHPDIHGEGRVNDMDCYAPSAQRVADPFEQTTNSHHQDSRPASQESHPASQESAPASQGSLPASRDSRQASQDSRPASHDSQSPPTVSQSADANQAQPRSTTLPTDNIASSKAPSTPAEAPPAHKYASGSVDPSHLLPPQSQFSPQAPSVQRLNDTRGDHS